MGEKETGAATEEVERRQHGPGPMRPTSSLRESPSRASGGSTSLRESPSRASSGRSIPENSPNSEDDDGDSPLESSAKNSAHATESLRSGVLSPDTDQPSDLDDDGVGTLDEGPVSVLKTKTKSNQSNDRLGREDDPAAVDDDGDGAVDEDPVSVLKTKTKSNQSNDRLGQEGVAIEGTPKTPIP